MTKSSALNKAASQPMRVIHVGCNGDAGMAWQELNGKCGGGCVPSMPSVGSQDSCLDKLCSVSTDGLHAYTCMLTSSHPTRMCVPSHPHADNSGEVLARSFQHSHSQLRCLIELLHYVYIITSYKGKSCMHAQLENCAGSKAVITHSSAALLRSCSASSVWPSPVRALARLKYALTC